MFGQSSNRESLRNLVLAAQAHANKVFHLGFGKAPPKSDLPKANNNRDCHIFKEFAYRTMAEAQKCRAVEIFKLGGMYASDSNTIDHATVSLTGPIQDKERRDQTSYFA